MLGDDEIFTHVRCETLFLENGFEGRRYEGERSTQFVRYIGKEFQFELGNLLLLTLRRRLAIYRNIPDASRATKMAARM